MNKNNTQIAAELHDLERHLLVSAPRLRWWINRGDLCRATDRLRDVSNSLSEFVGLGAAYSQVAEDTASSLHSLAERSTALTVRGDGEAALITYAKLLIALPDAHARIAPLLDDGGKGGDTPLWALDNAVTRALKALMR